jgi:GxxExxY protein
MLINNKDMIDSIAREIFEELGTGHRECVYHRAFEIELRNRSINYECEVVVPIFYKGQFLSHMRLDLVVEKNTVIELKTVKNIKEEEIQQLKRYLKATNMSVGYLINFGHDGVDVKKIEP